MKITEKQLLMLVDIAKAAVALQGSFAGYSVSDRIHLVNEIINQQSNKIFDVKDDQSGSLDMPHY